MKNLHLKRLRHLNHITTKTDIENYTRNYTNVLPQEKYTYIHVTDLQSSNISIGGYYNTFLMVTIISIGLISNRKEHTPMYNNV